MSHRVLWIFPSTFWADGLRELWAPLVGDGRTSNRDLDVPPSLSSWSATSQFWIYRSWCKRPSLLSPPSTMNRSLVPGRYDVRISHGLAMVISKLNRGFLVIYNSHESVAHDVARKPIYSMTLLLRKGGGKMPGEVKVWRRMTCLGSWV